MIAGISLNIPDTTKPRIVIIGGGFGGLNLVKKLPLKEFQVVMFDKHNYHTFQPLLYQVATAGLQPDSIAGPLRNVFSDKPDFHFRLLKVLSVDCTRKTIDTVAGALSYDYLIIASGSRANFFGNTDVQKFSFPLKSIPEALNLRSQLMQVFEIAGITNDPAQKARLMNVVLVGAGPTGVETAGALAELRRYVLPKDYPDLDFSKMNIYLIEGSSRVLPSMSEYASVKAKKSLEKMKVIVKLNSYVDGYDGKTVRLKSGETIEAQTVVWSAGVTGDILSGLPQQALERGRILTDEHCKVLGTEGIYAIGDVSCMKSAEYPNGHPGVAQVAIQMGTFLGKNMVNFHTNSPVNPFKYFDKGSLATIGRNKAVADFPGNLHVAGRPAWYVWLFIHIAYLIGFRNKLLVFINWIWSYITYDQGNRLIIRPFIRKDDKLGQEIATINEFE